MSAWRIEIRTGFYHRAKKTRPIKGLKLNPAIWRGCVLLAQCETLGENLSKTGTTRKSCPLYLLASCHSATLQKEIYCFTTLYVFVIPLSAVKRTRYMPAGSSEVFIRVSMFSSTPKTTTTPCAFNNAYVPRNSPFTIRN